MSGARRLGLLLCSVVVLFAAADRGAHAKDGALTFDKVVIVGGGNLSAPVAITDASDIADSALDSIRPQAPPSDELGTAYRLLLYPEGSDVTMAVTYYASKSGDRGYIYRAEAVSIGGGTIDPGWDRPSEALESALRKYGAANIAAGTEGSGLGPQRLVIVAVVAAPVLLLIAALGWLLNSRRRSLSATAQ